MERRSHRSSRAGISGRNACFLFEEVDIRSISYSSPLHRFTQIWCGGKVLRALQIFGFKQKNDLVWVVGITQKMEFL